MNNSIPASREARANPVVRFLPVVARLLLGLPLVVFGLNGFLNFIPQPEVVLPERATVFVGALVASGYMMPLIAGTHLLVGLLLVFNRAVPLALVVFAPFMVHSIAFHVFLERSGLPMALLFLAFELYLAWVYRASFRTLFVPVAPGSNRYPPG